MYRVKGDTEQEKRFLEFALESYTRVFEREPGEVSNARLMYLLGELNRRLKNYNVAVKWFARVVNDKSILDSGMIRACRDMWAETRQNMQDDKVEMTEDIGELK
jgi:uncharacterized protein (DUF2225 family)